MHDKEPVASASEALIDPIHTQNTVAVLFSGWLGVSVPSRGRGIREALANPLSADIYVAGTFLRDDCAQMGAPNRSACADMLWNKRLLHLHPIAGRLLEPMPSLRWLQAQVTASPHWRAIRNRFRTDFLYQNLSIFSPVLGSTSANVLRELVSYERAYALLGRAEAQRGRLYEHLLFSRLEYTWLAPHPPIGAFMRHAESPSIVWAPTADANGMNDRHAVMPRKAGSAYFQRWSALISAHAVPRFTVDELVTLGPETFLQQALLRGPGYVSPEAAASSAFKTPYASLLQPANSQEPAFKLGEFALPAFLACCDLNRALGRCWAVGCFAEDLLQDKAIRLMMRGGSAHRGAHIEESRRGDPSSTARNWGLLPRAPTVAQLRSLRVLDVPRHVRTVHGKYQREMRDALWAWRWMQCLPTSPPASSFHVQPLAQARGLEYLKSNMAFRMQLAVAAGDAGAGNESDLVLSHTLLNRSYRAHATPSHQLAALGGACPLAYLRTAHHARAGRERAASAGWCPQPPPPMGFCARAGVQRTLLDCAHACIACEQCVGLHFSRDQSRCTLHSTPCRADATAPAEASTPAARSGGAGSISLRSPDEEHGWDVISIRRAHLHRLLGRDATEAARSGLSAPRAGHCGPTEQGEEGDCATGDRGSLPFGPGEPEVFGVKLVDDIACVRFCAERCPKCNYVSISAKGKDCSWYSRCRINNLEHEPAWLGHKTYDVGAMRRARGAAVTP